MRSGHVRFGTWFAVAVAVGGLGALGGGGIGCFVLPVDDAAPHDGGTVESGGSSSGSGSGSSGANGGDSGVGVADSAGVGVDSGGGGLESGSGGSDAPNAQCAYVDQTLKSGLIGCPNSGSNLCTIVYVFGSNGCYSSSICETDGTSTSCTDTEGSWTQTGCNSVTLTECGGSASSTSTILQGPLSGDSVTVDGISFGLGGATNPPSCNGAGPAPFLGSPGWSGTESVSLSCGDAGTHGAQRALSGLVFQPTDAGIGFTDDTGCTYDFTVCGSSAKLTSPVTCTVTTDSGVVTEQVSVGTLTTKDGHHLSGALKGSVTEGTLDCQSLVGLALTR
jgi:hypothetical protein